MSIDINKGTSGEGDKGDGGTTDYPKWMAQNAGDNKTNKRLAEYQTTDEISNAYLAASDELTSFKDGKVFVPGENASEEEKRTFLTSLGVPKEAKDYKKVDSKLPEGVGYTEEEVAEFNEMAFKHGWTAKQHEGHHEWEEKVTLARIELQKKIIAESKADMLKHFEKEWGSDYSTNMNLMKKGVSKFGGDDFLIKLGLAGNLPEVINFLVEKGRSVADDTLLDGEHGKGKPKVIPGQMNYPSMEGM